MENLNTFKEALISFETAKLAKDKGFNIIDVHVYYHINEGYTLGHALCYSEVNEQEDNLLLAPTQGLLQKWLRDKHKIRVLVDTFPTPYSYQEFQYSVSNNILPSGLTTDLYDSYEEALEEGLQEGLKLIKQ